MLKATWYGGYGAGDLRFARISQAGAWSAQMPDPVYFAFLDGEV